jgi:lysosomal acid lipase/cholesteryl ester hydrolase
LISFLQPKLIAKYGYPVENHKVITEDGYVLTIHRIPHGKNEVEPLDERKRPIAFLQHGLFASSFEWMMNEPDKLLGKSRSFPMITFAF